MLQKCDSADNNCLHIKFAGEPRMDARSVAQRIAAIVVFLAGVVGVSLPVFAGPVHIYGGEFNLPLLDPIRRNESAMTEAIVEIPDHFVISDLNVGISLKHTKVFDLQIFLQSPSGKRLCLNMYNPYYEYFEGEDYEGTIFDDEAELSIEQGQPPFTGRFRPRAIDPSNLLEIFDEEDTYGAWRLQIYDMWPADTGTLDSFELIFTIPEPATAMLLILGAGLATLFKRRSGR